MRVKILIAMFFTVCCSVVHGVHDPVSVDNKTNYATDVIYQIMTDRFSDGNKNNNPGGALFDSECINLKKYCGGDWQGIINKIDDGYFSDLGITALWISQPLENIFAVIDDEAGSTSYHGYWARDYKKTNPFFGDFEDFDNLISVAHANNIKIIIDFAPNHTSPADEDNPSKGENGRLYDNGNLLGGYTNDIDNLFHHNGGTDFSSIEDGIYRNLFDLADYNLQNPTIDNYMKDAIALWLDKGIDGIRVDAVKHMPLGWQKNWMDFIYSHKPVFTFGEWFLGTNEVDPRNHAFANESGMSLLDFQFGQTVREVFRDRTDTMFDLHNMILDTAEDYDEVIDQVTFIDNHDMDRFHENGASTRELEQAIAFTLTSRGVPAIYYGTEHYMTGIGDPNNRAMMPSFERNTVAFEVIKRLAPLRKINPALGYGDTQERWINDDVYIYERAFGQHIVLVAINRSTTDNYNISGLVTSLPPSFYGDVLGGTLQGNGIAVDATGAVTPFQLSAGEVGVWHTTGDESSPNIGHVGPMLGRPGQAITIDGAGFGYSQGQVFIGSTPANITSWSDSQIKIDLPQVAAGKYDIRVVSENSESSPYPNLEILTAKQVSVRFIVNDAFTNFGQNVYLVGNVHELGGWDTESAIGPLYNQVMFQYPTWYFDVSVPASTALEFKFIKKDGSTVIWENGSNHEYFTPTSMPGTVNVNWQ